MSQGTHKEDNTPQLNPAHVQWQKQVLDMMKIGGIWAGKDWPIIVKKVSENEVEIITAPDDRVRQHIEAAGYKVVEPKKPT
jgi:hypothetical protein